MCLQEEEWSDRVAIGDDHEHQDVSTPQREAIERGRDPRRRTEGGSRVQKSFGGILLARDGREADDS
jgi:hypothetical protein